MQILIVTAKLLTGFDAPILQAMYLDKPLRCPDIYSTVTDLARLRGWSTSVPLSNAT